MIELYRDFIDRKADDVITALNGTITPTPVTSELYRDFLNRKADDVITALNGSITPAPAGDELYRDFIERKFDDVIAGIGGYVPPVTFPTLTGSIVTFNSQYAGLPLKSHTVDIDSVSGVSAINIGSDDKYAGFINFNQLVKNGNFADNSNWSLYNSAYTQMSIGNNVLTLTIIQQAVAGDYLYGVQQVNVIGDSSHKYLFSGAVKGSRSCKFTVELGGSRKGLIDLIANTKCDISFINTPATYNKNLLFYPSGGVKVNDTFEISNVMLIDLTAMFGSTKADEIYQMEQQTAGSGVAYFRSLFPNDYYDYNAGTLTTVSAVNGSTNSFFTIPIGQTVNEGEYNARTGVLEVTQPSVQTIQLPPCPIDTLEGVNNIWADTGDTTLQYIKIGGNT